MLDHKLGLGRARRAAQLCSFHEARRLAGTELRELVLSSSLMWQGVVTECIALLWARAISMRRTISIAS